MDIQISPELANALLVTVYLLGVSVRIAWPFAIAYMTEPIDFDWQKVKGQIVGAAIGLVGVVLAGMVQEGFVVGLGIAGYVGTFIAGYSAASIGRNGQKTIALRGK